MRRRRTGTVETVQGYRGGRPRGSKIESEMDEIEFLTQTLVVLFPLPLPLRRLRLFSWPSNGEMPSGVSCNVLHSAAAGYTQVCTDCTLLSTATAQERLLLTRPTEKKAAQKCRASRCPVGRMPGWDVAKLKLAKECCRNAAGT